MSHWSLNLSKCDLDKFNLDPIYIKPAPLKLVQTAFKQSGEGGGTSYAFNRVHHSLNSLNCNWSRSKLPNASEPSGSRSDL